MSTLSPQKGVLVGVDSIQALEASGQGWDKVVTYSCTQHDGRIEILDQSGVSVWTGGPAMKNQNFDNRDNWVRSNLRQLRIVGRDPKSFLE